MDSHARVVELAYRLGRLRGRSAADVMRALLRSKTLKDNGYVGGEHLTDRQAEVSAALLERWIRRTDEQH